MITLWRALIALVLCPTVAGAEATNRYLEFVRGYAAELRQQDRPPATAAEWSLQKENLREHLRAAWGDFPKRNGSPPVRKVGKLERDGYRVEKLLIETFPGLWMTANAYVPAKQQRMPAILMVHGHWKGAKQDPVVQSRCIGAAKLGFFVLAVDAFGAGERGVGRALGEYHGDMTAATLLPIGMPLSGIQVFENMCAVDYLQSRPEIDPKRIGITGASGGGNQSMYAGAWDERFAAVVPVCSVGNYQAYLGAACCMCEVVPGALRFTEEWAVLGLVAPRALMAINATRDARQFSVEEATVSLTQAKRVFRTLEKPENLHHSVFESGHDYSQPMREKVYGWMTQHLKNEANGEPISEPQIQTEAPEELRCFPGESRPEDWVTIPRFAATEGRRLLQKREAARNGVTNLAAWREDAARSRKTLTALLGGVPTRGKVTPVVTTNGHARTITFSPEPGITLSTTQEFPHRERMLIVIDFDDAKPGAEEKVALDANWSVARIKLRATGKGAWPTDKIGRAPDHTTAQWGLWIGRPLLGQWTLDVRRFIDAIQALDGKLPKITLLGRGPGALLATTIAALDDRISSVLAAGMLASYVTDAPYEGQRLGVLVPGILKEFGDVVDIAALVAPRPLLLQGGVSGEGKPLRPQELQATFGFPSRIYALEQRSGAIKFAELEQEHALRDFLRSN